MTRQDNHASGSFELIKWEKKNRLKFISNVEQSISKFYISNLEENINIVSIQHRVLRTNPAHYLLINNTERKNHVKQESNKLHQGKLHHLNKTRESGNIFPLSSFIKVIYIFLNISTMDRGIPIPSFHSDSPQVKPFSFLKS